MGVKCRYISSEIKKLAKVVYGEAEGANRNKILMTSVKVSSYLRENPNEKDINTEAFKAYVKSQKEDLEEEFNVEIETNVNEKEKITNAYIKNGAVFIDLNDEISMFENMNIILKNLGIDDNEAIQEVLKTADKDCFTYFIGALFKNIGLETTLEAFRSDVKGNPSKTSRIINNALQDTKAFKDREGIKTPTKSQILDDIFNSERDKPYISSIRALTGIDFDKLTIFQKKSIYAIASLMMDDSIQKNPTNYDKETFKSEIKATTIGEAEIAAEIANIIKTAYIEVIGNTKLTPAEKAMCTKEDVVAKEKAIFEAKKALEVEGSESVDDFINSVINGEHSFSYGGIKFKSLISAIDHWRSGKYSETVNNDDIYSLKIDKLHSIVNDFLVQNKELLNDIEKSGGVKYLNAIADLLKSMSVPKNLAGIASALPIIYKSVLALNANNAENRVIPVPKLETKKGLAASIRNKDEAKASIANKFIGWGVAGSSTAKYWKQYDDKKAANTGSYSKGDFVFMSINGINKNASEKERKEILAYIKGEERTTKAGKKYKVSDYEGELKKALDAGAIIITDKRNYINSSNYNVGEKAIYDFLANEGYVYGEIMVNGERLGSWSKEGVDYASVAVESTYEDINISYDTREYKPKTAKGLVKETEYVSEMSKLYLDMDSDVITNRCNLIKQRIITATESELKRRMRLIEKQIAKGTQISSEDHLYREFYNQGDEGRKKCIGYVINDIIKRVHDQIAEENEAIKGMSNVEVVNNYGLEASYVREQFDLMEKHFYSLLKIALPKINFRLGVTIQVDKNKEASTSQGYEDREEEESTLASGDDDQVAKGNESFILDSATKDHLKMSKENTRTVISEIIGVRRLNSKGEPIYEKDDLGNLKFLDEQKVYSILLMELSKRVKNADDFSIKNEDKNAEHKYSLPALEAIKNKYLWAQQVIDYIQDDPAKISAIFTDCCKAYVSNWDTYYDYEKGAFVTAQVNKPLAQQAALEQVALNMKEKAQVGVDETMLWTSQGKLNKKAQKILSDYKDSIKNSIGTTKNPDYETNVIPKLTTLLNGLGFEVSIQSVRGFINNNNQAREQIATIIANAGVILNDVTSKDVESQSLMVKFKGAYENIAELIGDISDTTNNRTFRLNGKDYQSYTDWNMMFYMQSRINSSSKEEFDEFAKKEFGYDDFLFDKNKGVYRFDLLNKMSTDKSVRDNFEVIYQRQFMRKEFSDWTEKDVYGVLLSQYFYDPTGKYAHYTTPNPAEVSTMIMLNLPRYKSNFVETINKKLVGVIKQELVRISKVKKRKALGVSEVDCFDKNGEEFIFLPQLNSYKLGDKTLYETLEDKKRNSETFTYDSSAAEGIIEHFISEVMNEEFEKFIHSDNDKILNMVLDEDSSNEDGRSFNFSDIKDFGDERNATELLREFFYNTTFASTQIQQLFFTDPAHFKDAVDLQKRFKQYYASGPRLNTNSEYGRKHQKVILLKDFTVSSTSIAESLKNAKRLKEEGLISAEDEAKIRSAITEINATDGQSFRCLSSMRSVLDMMGRWTPQQQKSFENFVNGTASKEDIATTMLTLKAFVSATIPVNDGIGGSMRVSVQYKNSEALMMAFVGKMILDNKSAESGLILGLNKYMEDNMIDIASFESTGKNGNQGIIDINYSRIKIEALQKNNPAEWRRIESEAKAFLSKDNLSRLTPFEIYKAAYDSRVYSGELTSEEYNEAIKAIRPDADEVYDIIDAFVKPFKHSNGRVKYWQDRLAEVDKNEQLNEKEKGKQRRAIKDAFNEERLNGSISENGEKIEAYPNVPETSLFDKMELSEYDTTGDVNESENTNIVHTFDSTFYMTAQESTNHLIDAKVIFGSQFRNIIISDLRDFDSNGNVVYYNIRGRKMTKREVISFYDELINANLIDDWKEVSKLFGSIESLKEELISIASGNPSYGPDVVNALELIDTGDGKDFNIPVSSPTISGKIEQLVLSVFKNRITKQYASGSACVLQSSFGFSEDLHVVRDEKTGQIKYFEVYMPANTKGMFDGCYKDILDEDGNVVGQSDVIDIEKVKQLENGKELLKAIGFRIPTEAKYSIANIRIKDFLPQEYGAVIMLPAETTYLSGEDYDIDKRYLIFKDRKTIPLFDVDKMMSRFRDIKGITADTEKYFNDGLKAFINYKLGRDSEAEVSLSEVDDYEDEYIEELKAFRKKGDISEEEALYLNYLEEFQDFYAHERNLVDSMGRHTSEFYGVERFGRTVYNKIIVPSYDFNKSALENSRMQRNNAIIDIAMEIWGHESSSVTTTIPGGYDNLRSSCNKIRIINAIKKCLSVLDNEKPSEYDEKYAKKYARKQLDEIMEMLGIEDIRNVKDLINIVRNLDDDSAKSIAKGFNKQTTAFPQAYVYFHKQNTAGLKLVGIYANNSAAISKFQDSNLELSENWNFEINGFKVGNLHMISRNINGIDVLLSRNQAEFSASSVDNVKDPLLADLNQAPNTAFISCAMIRMGFSIEEISLLCAQPFFSDKIKDIAGDDESLISDAKNSSTEISITTDMLYDTLLNPNSQYANEVKTALIRIVMIADRLKSLTQITRQDSPNGAVSNTIAGYLNQLIATELFVVQENNLGILNNYEDCLFDNVDDYKGDPEKMLEYLKTLPIARLHGFRYFGIDSAKDVLSPYFKQVREFTRSLVRSLIFDSNKHKLDDNIIRSFLEEMTTFALSKAEVFSKDINSERAYYISNFASDFAKAKKEAIFEKYKLMKSLSVDNNRIKLTKSIKTPGLKEDLQRDLVSMLMSKSSTERSMAIKLFKYSYYMDNLSWKADGFNYLFDSIFLSCIPSYIDTLRSLNFDESDNGLNWDEFYYQFSINHCSDIFFSPKKIQKDNDGNLVLSSKIKNSKTDMNFRFITYDDGLYQLSAISENGKFLKYKLVGKNEVSAFVYDANKSSSDLFSTTNLTITKFEKDNGISGRDSNLKKAKNRRNFDDMSFDDFGFENVFEELEDVFPENNAISFGNNDDFDINRIVFNKVIDSKPREIYDNLIKTSMDALKANNINKC